MKKFLLALFAVTFLSGCGEQIDAGNRGVKTVWGETQSVSLEEGLYFYNPFSTTIYEINCKTQRVIYQMSAYTKDVQQAVLQISVLYNVVPNEAHLLFKEIGIKFKNTIIEPLTLSATKDVIGTWEADNLVSSREIAAKTVLQNLRKQLEKQHISVLQVNFEDIGFSDEFEKAIEEKQIAQQDAIKAKNKTEQVKEEANQKILNAEAEARAIKIQSEALSKNKGLILYEAVKKWNGVLPVNVYGSMPVPFLNIKG